MIVKQKNIYIRVSNMRYINEMMMENENQNDNVSFDLS